jgi:hypothetical protein
VPDDLEEVDRMSRRNLKLNLIALLTGFALLLTALGCETVTGPTPDNSLSNPSEASFEKDAEGLNG